ncbi:MAG: antibiotic biosynthesis monooxygenase [Gammaproteobacteria bacterium]|nr:antibiotic biosynthesis monooxygenase [Gammaproteobacteria bacterium]
MFVAMSTFTVSNGMGMDVKDAFCNRPHMVDDVAGFIRMEVMNPIDDPEEFLLMTYWQDEASWKEWYHGHTYKNAHKGIPKGLKLDGERTKIRYFNVFSE